MIFESIGSPIRISNLSEAWKPFCTTGSAISRCIWTWIECVHSGCGGRDRLMGILLHVNGFRRQDPPFPLCSFLHRGFILCSASPRAALYAGCTWPTSCNNFPPGCVFIKIQGQGLRPREALLLMILVKAFPHRAPEPPARATSIPSNWLLPFCGC